MAQQNIILVAGAVIVEDGKLLLVRGGNDGHESFFMLPGGKLEHPLEDPFAAAAREAKEEVDIDVELIRPMRTLIVERPNKPDEYAVLMHFLCKRIGEPKATDDTEEFGWYPINDLPENVTPSFKAIVEELNEYDF